MATLLLQTAGAFAGNLVGGPIGAAIGQAIGAVAGATIDRRLFGPSASDSVGPRATSLAGVGSSEGSAMPRVYGRARVGGQMIWATRFEETTTVTRSGGSGGKGGGGPKTTTYSYFANFAIGLCEGPIAEVRRIWADGQEIDRTRFTIRVYAGGEDQQPDALIVAKEGTDAAPSYRGLAYVVFERMPLADFGNRVPQLTFEVVRPIEGVGRMIRAVDVIPGASEYAYLPDARRRTLFPGATSAENRHVLWAANDWTASMDALQALCPNLESVALVVSWFGDDLRCGRCEIAPRVESRVKEVSGGAWSVAGQPRFLARETSQIDGKPAYGGTPSDESVRAAIADLRARGLSVVFYPFVMMDAPAGNGREDPWSGAADQPAFPWRGRITCDPAPGRAGSVDATPAAGAQVAAFFGAPEPAADEWSFRRFVLHYARLCAQAGGVDAFLVGSELVGLTRVRSAPGVYPAAQALATLAADVRAILGPATKISYAADWTEYGAHVLDGGAEVRFPLDVVWAHPAVDFVGVDFWAPLSDWRDGGDHLDAAEAASIYDRSFLRARVAGGEAFDWHYADAAARAAQLRAPISDGAYGKAWTFRQKDLVGWWSNPHVERVAGVEASASGWTPRGKPIWLTEIGCPAVDRGANAPNVFPDPKSSEGGSPHFSRGFRDDLMQARAVEALLSRFDPALAGFEEAFNPVSPVYAGRMVEPSRIHVWAWDARPFPAFPLNADVWADAAQWATGHWLNGRLEGIGVDRLVEALCVQTPDVGPVEAAQVEGFADGYVLDRPMSPRSALEPLSAFFAFDGVVGGGGVRFIRRDAPSVRDIGADDLVPVRDGERVTLNRAQESELPRRLSVTVWDSENDYRTASVSSGRVATSSRREQSADLALATSRAQAQRRCDVWLHHLWIGRETARFDLRPGLAALEVGDVVTLPVESGRRAYRIERISDLDRREVEARAVAPQIYEHAPPRLPAIVRPAPKTPGPALVHVLDLAIARDAPATLQRVAVWADPWTGPMALWREAGDSFEFSRLVERPAIVGVTTAPFGPGPLWRRDVVNALEVRLAWGALSSVGDEQMLAGANAMALRGDEGAWEIVAFAHAQATGPGTWRLTRLLRGLGAQEHLAERTLPAGSVCVLLDDALAPLTSDAGLIGAPQTWRVAPATGDHADPAAVAFTAAPTDLALKPYAPVHAQARRVAEGVEIAFVRRSRVESDSWALVDVPLGEASELYEIDVLDGATVRRTLRTNSPRALYAAAEETADFGAPQTSLSLRICQISAAVGRGFALETTAPVRPSGG